MKPVHGNSGTNNFFLQRTLFEIFEMFSVIVTHALLTSLENCSAMEGAAPQLREKVVDPNSELVRDLFATFLEECVFIA